MMALKVSAGVTLDTDAVGPDSVKAAFDVAVDRLHNRVPVDWNTLEVALHRRELETDLILRAVAL